MSAFYDGMAATALSLLERFGQAVTITRTTRTIDPVSGVTSEMISSGTFTAVNPPASKGTVEAFDNRLLSDAAHVNRSLRFLIVAASGAPFVPAALDIVTMGGIDYEVAGVTPVSPDGTDLVYKIGMFTS